MSEILSLLYVLIVVFFAIRVILRDDLQPPSRLAWLAVIIAIPVVGVIIYYMFGEVSLGKKTNRIYNEINQVVDMKRMPFMGEQDDIHNSTVERCYYPAFKYANYINGFYTVGGNLASLTLGAEDTRDRIIADMDAAKDHIHLLYYIWLDDHTGREIAQALLRAVQRGVCCRVIVDGIGSRDFIKSDTWQKMEKAGVQSATAFPVENILKTLFTSRIDLRNHRKITIIDGDVVYCGSRNAADPEFRIKAKYAPWVDIMLRITGPIVSQKQLLFLTDWFASTGEKIDLKSISLSSMPLENKDGFWGQVVGGGPTVRHGSKPQLLATLITCAQEKIHITTPYFIPNEALLDALCAAALRGVEVVLIFPKKNDSWIVAAASRSYYGVLLESGCKIFEYKGGLLHAKTLVVDDKITFMGSSNLDRRSFDLNYENDVLIYDEKTTAEVRQRQKEYMLSCDPIVSKDVLAWSVFRHAWHNAVATVGPIL